MSDILSFIQTQPELSAYIGAGAFGFLLLLLVTVKLLRKTATRRRIKRVLKSFGGQIVENVALSDGVDGVVHIDFCVYARGRIFVLNIQDYPGILFGGEKIEQWTQLYHGKSYKFTNPLYYSHFCVQAVKDQLPGAAVFGRVVFTHNGDFPKGIPEGVSMLDKLAHDAKTFARVPVNHDASIELWQDFVESLSKNNSTKVYKMQAA